MAERRANQLAVITLALAMLGNIVTGAYFYGRLAERVDAIEKNTQLLLEHQLRREERATR